MNSRQLAKTWPFRRYKAFERELRDAAARWFSSKGLVTHSRMRYCLRSHDSWAENIICSDVVEYIRQEQGLNQGKNSFPLHKYLHHGLSSQAMVFNLVGPLIVSKDLEPLRIAIKKAGINWPTGTVEAVFEYDDRAVFNEDSGQPTSIDLALWGETGRVFIEAKLVEREFGGCSVFAGGDCDGRNPLQYGYGGCYLHHIGRGYWERMNEYGFDSTPLVSGAICPFVNYYQFFREVLFSLSKDGCFILLYDERNPAFLKTSGDGKDSGLWPFLMEAVPPEHADRVGRLTIQQLVREIEVSGRHNGWINEFREKYAIE